MEVVIKAPLSDWFIIEVASIWGKFFLSRRLFTLVVSEPWASGNIISRDFDAYFVMDISGPRQQLLKLIQSVCWKLLLFTTE